MIASKQLAEPGSENTARLLLTKLLPRILIGLALLAFIGYFIVYSLFAYSLFQFPFDYDQGEGFELMNVVLFSKGESPYRSSDVYPFYSTNYAPVFHLVLVPLVWIFGPQYWTGRLVSYLGTLVTAAAIGYAVQRQGKRWWLSLLSGLAFLASNYVYHVGPLFRQHMFMVLLETLAVVFLAWSIDKEEREGRRSWKRMLLVVVLLLAAGYTKQLAYATVLAVFLFLFLRQPKRAILWGIIFGLLTGLIFLAMTMLTDGHWFISTVASNVNRFVPGQATAFLQQWFRLHVVITIVALLMSIYQLYFERLSVYSVWFVVAAINGVTAGKWGAGESYFATAIAASCILTGLAFNRLLNWSQKRGWRSGRLLHTAVMVMIPLLFLVQADRVFHMPTHTPILRAIASALGKPTDTMVAPQTGCSAPLPAVPIPYVDSAGVSLLGRPPTAADTAAGQQIAGLVGQGNTPAFSEDAGFNFYTGREIVTNPPYLLNLYENNLVDLTEMISLLDQQAFDTVILRSQFYPMPVLQMIGQRYVTTDLVEMNGYVYCIMRARSD
jgi:hypothetical protein